MKSPARENVRGHRKSRVKSNIARRQNDARLKNQKGNQRKRLIPLRDILD
jgi:hypothetical protein